MDLYDKDNQIKYWNSVADNASFHQELDMELFKKYIHEGSKILDYGCGYGRTLGQLKKMGYKDLTGIDFSPKMIERAQRETEGIKYIIADCNIELPENYYDAITLIFLFASVYTDKEQDIILSKIKKALKPNGIIYICDALLGEDERNVSRYNKYLNKYNVYGTFENDDGMIARHLDENRAKEIRNSFEEITYIKQSTKTHNGNFINSFTYVGKK